MIGSYYWTKDRIKFTGHMTYNHSLQRPLQYKVTSIKPLSFEDAYQPFTFFDNIGSGELRPSVFTFSNFAIRIELSRIMQPHLISTYLPSFLIVLSSWFSFLIGTASIPGRLTVTVVLLLVLINMRYFLDI